ncbi:MAG: hypothetical protein VX899_11325 [Myxococcota bacterium]|nr:hypothetical protein [Myxococcota bacterium]
MERAEARRVLSCLAQGQHPIFGGALPDHSVCHEVDVVRALVLAAKELERNPKTPAVRAGAPWSEDEEQRLRDGHEAGRSRAELSKELGRSRGAVTARLVKLGLLEPDTPGHRFRV